MKASLDFAAATEADSSASSAVYAVGDHVVVLKFALATVGVVAEVRDGVYGVRCARRSMIVCEFMCVRVCMCVCVCASVCVCVLWCGRQIFPLLYSPPQARWPPLQGKIQ